MTRDKIRSQAEERMKKSIQSLQDEFKTLRGNRASQTLFEKIRVDYYGDKVPLNQVATISIPEARLVIIQPWDRSVLSEICLLEQPFVKDDKRKVSKVLEELSKEVGTKIDIVEYVYMKLGAE